jgi:predicted ribosomally synthesized peptide with nif11-like leader
MTMKNVVDFFAVVKEDETLQQRTHVATDIDEIIELAREQDYKFNGTELQAFLGKMPKKELASLINPGIGNRLHMSPR